jgi:DNA-binding LytR/AlgR family response regulator
VAGSEPDIRVVIADDEPLARHLLVRLIGAQPGVTIAGVATDGESARRMINETSPDLVFLDVEMPKRSGVELLAGWEARASKPYVVFVTAFARYAIEAFDLDAVDYLVKPIEKQRLRRAIERARRAIRAAPVRTRHVLVRRRDELLRVPESDVYWLQAASQYVRVHTETAQYMVAESLNKCHAKLGSDSFLRVHRSAVVNVSKVQRVLKRMNGVHELRLVNGVGVPLSRSRKALVDGILDAAARNRRVN